MTPGFRLALLIAAGTLAAVLCDIGTASAQSPQSQRRNDANSTNYGPGGPNVSYQQDAHTRIYISRRSWLDGGTEVLPGDRKFTNYAFPDAISFGRENANHNIDRQPLNPPSDMGGWYPLSFPLY